MGDYDETLSEIAGVLSQRGPALVLSGAGMSVASGIPCYRPWPEPGAPVEEFEAAREWRWTNSVTNNTHSTHYTHLLTH